MAIIFDKNYNISCKEIIENSGYTQLDFTTTYDILCHELVESASKPSGGITVDKNGKLTCYRLEEQAGVTVTEDIFTQNIEPIIKSYQPTLSYTSNTIYFSNFSTLVSQLATATGLSDDQIRSCIHFFYIEGRPRRGNPYHHNALNISSQYSETWRTTSTQDNLNRPNLPSKSPLYSATYESGTNINSNGSIDMTKHNELLGCFHKGNLYKKYGRDAVVHNKLRLYMGLLFRYTIEGKKFICISAKSTNYLEYSFGSGGIGVVGTPSIADVFA